MKKIIAIVLSVLTVISLSALPAFAEDAKGDFDFLTAMGFVKCDEDNVALEKEYVSRIALAEIFYNIVFPTQDNTSNTLAIDFPDVSADKKHVADFVYGMGVMRGYSDTVFAPDNTVTYNQAIKAIVSFLGYDLMAQNLGGYPSGYLAQATRLQILPGGNISGDAKATYGGIATILKKAVGVDIAIWNHTQADGTALLEVQKGVDYLQYYRGIKNTNGIVTGNYLTDIQGGEASSFFGIYLEGEYYNVSESAHGIQDCLGKNIYIYYTEDGSRKTAVYFEESINSVLQISAKDIASVQQGAIKYYVDGLEGVYSADFDTNSPLIYNGTYESAYLVSDINPFPGSNLDGNIKLIDTNNDGIYDMVVVSAYETVVANDIKNNKIYGMYNTTGNIYDKVIDITNYRERNMNIRDITGALMTPEGLKKGDVLNIARDKSGKIKEIIASKDSMTGVLEEISYEGSKISTVKIAGTTFSTSNGLVVMDSENKIAPGLTANVFFNLDAEIALIDVENHYTKGYQTGYLVDAGTEGTLAQKIICMIFTSEGEMKTFTIPSRIAVNGLPCESDELLNKFGYVGKRVKRQAILFKTDLEGTTVTAFQIATQLSNDREAFNGFYRFPGDEYAFSGGMGTFSGKYMPNTGTVIFGVPDEAERDNYEGYKLSALEYNEDFKLTASEIYGSREDALMVDVAVISNKVIAGNSDSGKRPLFVVSKVSTILNEKGETRIKVSGVYVERVAIKTGSFLIKPELFINGHDVGIPTDANNGKRPFINQSKTLPEPGDIYRTSVFGSTGEIEYMNVKEFFQLYDYKTKAVFPPSGEMDDYIGGGGTYAIGEVDFKDSGVIKIIRPDDEVMAFNLSAGSYKYIEINGNSQNGEPTVKISTDQAISANQIQPGEGSRILLYYRGTGIACVVINDK